MVRTRYCCICGLAAEKNPGLAFFKFPRSESAKKQWMEAIGRHKLKRPVTDASYVCSNHFKDQDWAFSACLRKGIRKEGAVPSFFDDQQFEPSYEVSVIPDPIPIHSGHEPIPSASTACSLHASAPTASALSASALTASAPTASASTLPSPFPSTAYHPSTMDIENTPSYNSSLRLLEKLERNVLDSPRKVFLKKKLNLSTNKLIKAKKSLKLTRLENNRLRKQKVKLQRKILSLNEIIKEVQNKCYLTHEVSALLEDSGTGVKELFERNLAKNKKKKVPLSYSPNIRKFALTLNFYSPRAYKYVRKSFNNCLPHPKTIGKWYQSIDGAPGFSEEALNSLKLRSENDHKRIPCALLLDEMAIRQHIECVNNQVYGYVDCGVPAVSDDCPIAKNALVFMIVPLNSNWKLPVGYFLIDSLGGLERKDLILRCISLLHQNGVDVECVTFDGAASNISMAKNLGCSLDLTNFRPRFPHPVSGTDVHVFLDACHMLKLVRNTFGDFGYLKDMDGNGIKFSLIKKLHQLQEETGLHLRNKLKPQHVSYFRKKMNVKLAAQMLSDSVADSLQFCMDNNIEGFEDATATIKFLRTFNRLFDVFNSRNLLSRAFKKPLCTENFQMISHQLKLDAEYVKGLQCPNTGQKLICSNRKTGFLGFLMLIEGTFSLYNKLNDLEMSFLCTYKFSQDHLELFFGKIRAYGACNNNPTARHFAAAYKRLMLHNDLSDSLTGNCYPLEKVPILTVSSASKTTSMPLSSYLVRRINESLTETKIVVDDSEAKFELDFDVDTEVQYHFSANDTYYKNVVSYVGGFVVRQIIKKLKCSKCCECLSESSETLQKQSCFRFLNLVSKGNLIYPSKDVVTIYLSTEQQYKANISSFAPNLSFNKLVNLVSLSLLGMPIFESLREHSMDTDPLSNHIGLLIKAVSAKYLECRVAHAAKMMTAKLVIAKNSSSRQMSNKLILFSGL